MKMVGRWMGTALCSSLAPVDMAAGRAWAAAAHWLVALAGKLASAWAGPGAGCWMQLLLESVVHVSP